MAKLSITNNGANHISHNYSTFSYPFKISYMSNVKILIKYNYNLPVLTPNTMSIHKFKMDSNKANKVMKLKPA